MSDILVSIIIIIVVALAIAVIFVLTSRKKLATENALQQLADKSGWKFEKVNHSQQNGYIFSTEDWILEALVSTSNTSSESGSSANSFNNTWRTTRVTSPAGIVLIGSKMPSVNLGGLGELIFQKGLQRMLGTEADQAVGLEEVFVGRTSFRDRFSVWATDQDNAAHLLTFEIENALLNWKFKEIPVIKFSAAGVMIISRQERLDTPEKVQALIDLGEAVLSH
jgi:hypothetical protein